MFDSLLRFIKDEKGFDLVQWSLYTAIAAGTISIIWWGLGLKDKITGAGQGIGNVIDSGNKDLSSAK